MIFDSLQQRHGGGAGVRVGVVVCRKRTMCIGAKLAFIYVAVACGVGVDTPYTRAGARSEEEVTS